MANTLKNIFNPGVDQIAQTYTIESWHVSQSIDAFTGAQAYDIVLSGSFTLSGSSSIIGSLNVTGSVSSSLGFYGTSSWAANSSQSTSASYALTASYALSSAGGANAGGADKQIQFNSGSTLSGSSNFRYNYNLRSFEMGDNVVASGTGSFAQGINTSASGLYSHAEGFTTLANGYSSHAEGFYTTSSGVYSHAEGSNTVSPGANSHAEGYSTISSGSYSHAGGISAYTSHISEWARSSTPLGQYGILSLSNQTSGTTPAELLISSSLGNDYFTIPSNTAYFVDITVMGTLLDAGLNGASRVFKGNAIIKNYGGTTVFDGGSLVLSPTTGSATYLSASAAADNSHDRLAIYVTGSGTYNVAWFAKVEYTKLNNINSI